MKERVKENETVSRSVENDYVKRSPVDRRSLADRRMRNMEGGYPGTDRRVRVKDRRRGWEDRYGWERNSQWSSSPLFPDFP